MHEISVLHEAVETVERIAIENHIEKIASVTFELGELSGMLPVFFEKYYPVVTEDRPRFEGSKLIMKVIPGQALCGECESLYNVMKNEGACPLCKSREKTILGGRDFSIREIAAYESQIGS